MSARTALAIVTAALTASAPALAYCPSYTPAQTAGGANCGVDPVPGKNPTVAEWQSIFATVAGGKASWGSSGPSVAQLGRGCGKPTPTSKVDATFPCHVLMGIAMQESGWKQFCVPDRPAGSVGAPERTIVSFDCGYGVGQVTSGMRVGEMPSFDRLRVAAEPVYNLATGTQILASKWAATNCVGDNLPEVVEHWYAALWAYNGLSYTNNPNNPKHTAGRGPYNPANGGAYPYQEKVLGWMEFPPSSAHWKSLAAAYPNRGDIGGGSAPPALPEPKCASPTSCTTTRPTHQSSCSPSASDAGVPPDPTPVGDGAAPPPDPIDPDGGNGVQANASGGCSCDVAATRGQRTAAWLAAAAILALRRRRKR
jgi:MYXO-CTERM domain-containing protein